MKQFVQKGRCFIKFHTNIPFDPNTLDLPPQRQISSRSRRRRRVLWRKVNAKREDSNNSFCATSAHHRKEHTNTHTIGVYFM